MNEPDYRVIVCGSREWSNRALISHSLAALREQGKKVTIVHGDARGADTLAASVAANLGYAVEAYPANWARFGRGAGPIRNEEMASMGADLCLAFWDGHSKGTKDMISRAREHEIPVQLVFENP